MYWPIVVTAPSSVGNKFCPMECEPKSNSQMAGGLFRRMVINRPTGLQFTLQGISKRPSLELRPSQNHSPCPGMQKPALPELLSIARKSHWLVDPGISGHWRRMAPALPVSSPPEVLDRHGVSLPGFRGQGRVVTSPT